MAKAPKSDFLRKGWASLLPILAGSTVLAAWAFPDHPVSVAILRAFDGMKINTAVCFILSGIALHLLSNAPGIGRIRQTTARLLSVIVFAVAFLSTAYYFGWDSGINGWWAKTAIGGNALVSPGNMSLIVSVNFGLLSIALMLLGHKKFRFLIQVLLMAIIPGSFVVIVNRLFGVSFLTAIPFRAPTSMITALLFVILVIGVFVSPALGYVQFSFVKKVAVFFVLIFLVRSTVFFAINRNNQLASDKDRWQEHNHGVILLAERLNTFSDQLQSNTRVYIITGDPRYGEDPGRETDSLHEVLARLRTLTRGNGLEQVTLDSIESGLGVLIRSEESLVAARRNAGFDAARQLMLLTDAGNPVSRVHDQVRLIEQQENALLEEHKTHTDLIVNNSARVFTFFQILAALLMVVAFKMVYDHVRLRNRAQEALQNSLKQTSDYQYALNESSIMAITDQKGIIKQVNDNFCKISKYSREELIGRDHRLINSSFHSREFIRDLWVTIANGNVWRGELRNRTKTGEHYWVDTTIVPFLNKAGKPYQYLAIRTDITARKNLEEEILQMNRGLQRRVEEKTREILRQEQQYRFLLQNMREGIQLIGYDWTYLFVNDSAVAQSTYGKEELIGHSMIEKFPGLQETNLFHTMQRCMKERCSQVLEDEFTFPDGTREWFEFSIQPVPEGLFVLSMNIGERKQIERQLQESERFLNDSQEVSQIGSYVLDLGEGRWKASRELDNILGLDRDQEHLVETWLSIIHPEDRQMMHDYFDHQVIGRKQPFDKEYRIINAKTGKERSVHGIGDLEIAADGTILKMIGTIQDITERKQLEKKIAEQKLTEQRLINEITIQTQEKERKELGRELHDNINQILAIVKMYLGMLKSGDHSSRENLLEKSYEYVDEAMLEIRKLSHSLVAPSLGNLGLKEALEALAHDTNLVKQVRVNLHIDETYHKHHLDKTRELMLYRVVQEQLNNITKYANARDVAITLKKENSVLFLTIADDGVGFDTSKRSGSGIGLSNMKSRIEFYSGTLNIISAPMKGCKLEIAIPSAA